MYNLHLNRYCITFAKSIGNMLMKMIYTYMAAALLLLVCNKAVAADGDVTILDLSKAAETLTFGEDGTWDKIYEGSGDMTYDYFEAQIFKMSHLGYSSQWTYFDGFAPCTSTNMKDDSSYSAGCMAGGGIALDGGEVAKDGDAVVTDAAMPYLVGYFTTDNNPESSCQIMFNDGNTHEVVGAYVTNFPTSFYNCLYGNGFANAFVNGDYLTLTIHGVAADNSEKTVEVDLVRYEDDMLRAIRAWKYVDLSSLGAVRYLYFTMDGSDKSGEYLNTAAYFCLDKLTVKTAAAGVADVEPVSSNIVYDRQVGEIVLPQSEFAIIYNAQGQKVMSCERQRISTTGLESGVYFVKTATGSLKFIK